MVLESLGKCTSVEDITTLGVKLTESANMWRLQSDIVKARLVFDYEDYWGSDYLVTHSVEELLGLAVKETGTVQVLHLLQCLQVCCPVLSDSIGRLLEKTSR